MLIQTLLQQSIETKQRLLESNYIETIQKMADLMIAALKNKKKLLIAGNGGSAADAQHFAAELAGQFILQRRGLMVIALTTNSSNLTAIANDFHYDEIFSRQVDALGEPGDVFVAISTSGNSANILRAIEAAKISGLSVVGFSGKNGGKMDPQCDFGLIVPSDNTQTIQEAHITVIHILCALIDEAFGVPHNASQGKYIFLDRDGVIIKDKNYMYDPKDIEFMPGAIEGLLKLQTLGYKFIVLTNQAGVARGYFSFAQAYLFNQELERTLALKGIRIERTYICPHHPEFTGSCQCRKPKMGMALQAAKEFGINLKDSIFIGDKDSDIHLGNQCEGKTFLINNGQYETSATPYAAVRGILEVYEHLVVSPPAPIN